MQEYFEKKIENYRKFTKKVWK